MELIFVSKLNSDECLCITIDKIQKPKWCKITKKKNIEELLHKIL